jgi:CheY-like chemotaxis protein
LDYLSLPCLTYNSSIVARNSAKTSANRHFYRNSSVASKIPLCFYPTQIVFVDDNIEFLESLSMALSKTFTIKIFNDTDAAIKYINEYQREAHLIANEEKPKPQGESEVWVKQVLTHPNTKRFNEFRIKEVSVLVVDYSMPSMNGIEFCEKIKNSSIKKILLTGLATPAEAIKAFNNNTIHYYLKKDSENMPQELEVAILQLQHSYFNEFSSSLKAEAIDSSTPFFTDPKLAEYFNNVCVSLDVIEHYYLTNPSRFALRTRDNRNYFCVIYTEENITEHLQILQEEGAPEELYKTLASRQYVPMFNTADGYYEPGITKAAEHIHPAVHVHGAVNYYCAIISDTAERPTISTNSPTRKLH